MFPERPVQASFPGRCGAARSRGRLQAAPPAPVSRLFPPPSPAPTPKLAAAVRSSARRAALVGVGSRLARLPCPSADATKPTRALHGAADLAGAAGGCLAHGRATRSWGRRSPDTTCRGKCVRDVTPRPVPAACAILARQAPATPHRGSPPNPACRHSPGAPTHVTSGRCTHFRPARGPAPSLPATPPRDYGFLTALSLLCSTLASQTVRSLSAPTDCLKPGAVHVWTLPRPEVQQLLQGTRLEGCPLDSLEWCPRWRTRAAAFWMRRTTW
ncbi:translation initiation factor IF-2-like [Schistocerca piceifrons]|uniref:translation initiation factor IF-2-like n=1 Tax=Schistocerca piceifrons TaxID=274613 RepID=UPI001F5E6CE5|nr:translation initiation factor IF-2-like [Schistocerca piceifrons]